MKLKLIKPLLLVFIPFIIVISSFKTDEIFTGYKTKEFTFEGHEAKIVFPNKPNDDNYWIWRARFWGHEPQLDKALLEKGFHLVYVDVANLYGNNEAVEIWNKFYAFCRKEYNLNKRVVLEGMSRGGLIVYNWASQNTDKIFCIYADAPVCDIKSWPGGFYSGSGSPKDYAQCLEAYGLDSVSIKDFKGIPIYTCINVAKAGIPVLHVYGDADTVVPFEENTALLAEQFKNAGGTIKLITKEGVGHHPHCLEEPKPIADFILNSIKTTN